MAKAKLPILLASASPRRRELLALCGVDFTVFTTDTDETCAIEEPEALVLELSKRKAQAADLKVAFPCAIIAADTIVYCAGSILGKPSDENAAFNMLKALADNTHTVYTGMCVLVHGGDMSCRCCATEVTIGSLSNDEITAYIKTGEPMDKAGAYAVQGRFARYIKSIDGCYYNVMGLPLYALCRMFDELGLEL